MIPANKKFRQLLTDKKYRVSLTVNTALGCSDVASADVLVLMSCNIDVPNAFTPNGDGLNDFLSPINAIKAINLLFRVYNRYGQMIFESKDWEKGWDGTFKGEPQEPGVYVWTLSYTNWDTGKDVFRKGSAVLIR
jgi:gliding motility-associated-like protein